MFKKINQSYYALIISFVNLIFQIPFFKFVISNREMSSINDGILLVSLVIASIVLNAWFFYILIYLFRTVGKLLIIVFFMINSMAVYFINSYGVIINLETVSNVLNTNYDEVSSFFSLGMLGYLVLMGIGASVFVYKIEDVRPNVKLFLRHILLVLVFLLAIVFSNSSNWFWIDKNSKVLGGLVMPWSYIVNSSSYYIDEYKKNKKQILLPNATIKNNDKTVVVLVIGESARLNNFSLYGYEKNTNPLLSEMERVHHFRARSCATYTTAGIKCILEYKNTGKLFEILPNFLYRNGVDVVWRTTNFGEPNVNIEKYQRKGELEKLCEGNGCKYDEVLLSGLKEQILNSEKNKILIVLHTSTSHGPVYDKKYPDQFRKFTPVCESVEVSKCSDEELVNAYDNTIVYTDYILASLIDKLKELKDYKSLMLYVSDHGESLGEGGLYLHGIPASFAPDVQLEIPFIVWCSDESIKLKNKEQLSQHHVFHSILNFLDVDSPIYDDNMSIFKNVR